MENRGPTAKNGGVGRRKKARSDAFLPEGVTLPERSSSRSEGTRIAQGKAQGPRLRKARPQRNRNSAPHIPGIVFNLVLLEDGNELRLEIALLVMLFLAGDVCQGNLHLPPSNRKSSIAFLPLKSR